ncbi:DUF2177 family protein [Pseudomonas gingeri]|uniref:DUF2177 family protein n=1 Tax=Pseudomonas gingeri TaxID=117681 RepID=UPI00351CA489
MMRKALLAYLAMLLAFLVLDGLWLGVLMGSTYRSLLGPLMLEQPRWVPAILFYLLYGVGMLVLVVLPAAASRSSRRAAGLGALLGLVAYGTYDLSNWATLQAWSGQLALMDLAWGTLVSGLVSLVGYWRMRSGA